MMKKRIEGWSERMVEEKNEKIIKRKKKGGGKR